MIIIPDRRIGIRKNINGEWKILQTPTLYATGGIWNKNINSVPTTVYFGDSASFFYFLPVGVSKISNVILEDLNKSVKNYLDKKEEPKIETRISPDAKNYIVLKKGDE
jgi:hypothetical protein